MNDNGFPETETELHAYMAKKKAAMQKLKERRQKYIAAGGHLLSEEEFEKRMNWLQL